MGQFFSAVEGDRLTGSMDSYVMAGSSTSFIKDDKGRLRRMSMIGDNAYCGVCKTVGRIIRGAPCDFGARLYEGGLFQAVGSDRVVCNCDTKPAIIAAYGTDWIVFDTPNSPRTSSVAQNLASASAPSPAQSYDELIVLQDERGNPIAGLRYRITTEAGDIYEGVSNAKGETTRVSSNKPIYMDIELVV
ncbi:PAAR domain-containing protein [Caballeronia catudaia]|nr:hypothetical protein [Caballeronia catudaia]